MEENKCAHWKKNKKTKRIWMKKERDINTITKLFCSERQQVRSVYKGQTYVKKSNIPPNQPFIWTNKLKPEETNKQNKEREKEKDLTSFDT